MKTVTAGPKSLGDALKSPFWSRLLIAEKCKSTNIIIFLEGKDTEKPIKQPLERFVHELDQKRFPNSHGRFALCRRNDPASFESRLLVIQPYGGCSFLG